MIEDDEPLPVDLDWDVLRTVEDREPPLEFRVYLAGPLTNNDGSADTEYETLRTVTREVLAACREAKFTVYDPADVTKPGSGHSSDEVYSTDHAQTVRADLVFFNVNSPSLGVGIEAQIAADATTPRVVAFKPEARVSRMFRGVFAPTVAEIVYEDVADFREQLAGALPEIIARLMESAPRRRAVFGAIAARRVGRQILMRRIVRQVRLRELALQTDIRESWLEKLERDEAAAACTSLVMLNRIADALYCTVAIEYQQVALKPKEVDLDHHQKYSLQNLAELVLGGEGMREDRVLRLWAEDVSRRSEETYAARGDSKEVLSVEDWRQAYARLQEGQEGLFPEEEE